jgi:hypothetical protein
MRATSPRFRSPLQYTYIIILSIFALQLSAQDTALKAALETYASVDQTYIMNPNFKMPTELADKITHEVIPALRRNAYNYEEASLYFYLAMNAELGFKWEEMHVLLQNAETILKRINPSTDTIQARLGNVYSAYASYYALGKFDLEQSNVFLDTAEGYFQKAAMPERIVELQVTRAIGLTDRNQGKLAIKKIEQARKQYDSINATRQMNCDVDTSTFNYLYGRAHMAIADSLLQSGERVLNKKHLDSAIVSLNKVKPGLKTDSIRIILAMFSKGIAYWSRDASGDLDSAAYCLRKVKDVFLVLAGPGKDSPYSVAAVGYGIVLAQNGEVADGEYYLTEGLKSLGLPIEQNFNTTYTIKESSLYIMQALSMKSNYNAWLSRKIKDSNKLKQALEQNLYDAEQMAIAIDLLKNQLSLRSSLENFANRLNMTYASGISAAARLANMGGDKQLLAERAFALSESARAYVIRTQLKTYDRSQVNDMEDAKFTLKRIQNEMLGKNTAAISYSLAVDTLTALVFTQDKSFFVQLPPLPRWKEALEGLDGYFGDLDLSYSQEHSFYSQELFKQILRPILDSLSKRRNINELLIAPDDVLWKVRFDALETAPADSKKAREWHFLIDDDFAVSYTYGFRVNALLNALSIKKTNEKSLMNFVAKYNKPEDVLNVDFSPEDTLMINNAKEMEKALSKSLCENDYLFIAAHGEAKFNESAEKSFFRFENDQLTMSEIYKLAKTLKDSCPVNNRKTRMVFLTSCQSSRGDNIRGEGIISIARAFQFLGIPQLLAADAKIDNPSAFSISKSLQKKILTQPNAMVALKEAKKDFLSKALDSEPLNWANIRCFGYGRE